LPQILRARSDRIVQKIVDAVIFMIILRGRAVFDGADYCGRNGDCDGHPVRLTIGNKIRQIAEPHQRRPVLKEYIF
jgi:hypothetical protein